jgi:hypothetical protein
MFRLPRLFCVVLVLVSAILLVSGVASAQTLVQKNTTYTWLISGHEDDLVTGESYPYGPFVGTMRFEDANLQIFDHTANLAQYNGDEISSYQLQDSTGIYVISDGNPNDGQWYEYYEQPKMMLASIFPAYGQTVSQDGNWRGQWSLPGGGYEPWTGTYSLSMTNLGQIGYITTPRGRFQPTAYQYTEEYTKQPAGGAITYGHVTSTLWVVDDRDLVCMQEQWEDRTDWDGDGDWDYWNVEESVRYLLSAADSPAAAYIDADVQAPDGFDSATVLNALQAVSDTAVTTSLGAEQNFGGYGFLAGMTTLDSGSVDAFVDALKADGASDEQAFVRIELAYDEAALADAGISENDLAPYWWDEENDRWVLVGTTTAGTQGEGRLATLAAHEDLVGYYGIDTANHVVWMNVNHASSYGLMTPVPEPASMALLAAGGLFALRRRKR